MQDSRNRAISPFDNNFLIYVVAKEKDLVVPLLRCGRLHNKAEHDSIHIMGRKELIYLVALKEAPLFRIRMIIGEKPNRNLSNIDRRIHRRRGQR